MPLLSSAGGTTTVTGALSLKVTMASWVPVAALTANRVTTSWPAASVDTPKMTTPPLPPVNTQAPIARPFVAASVT